MKQYKPSEHQTDMLAEYIAGTVLKYDKNYETTLLTSDINAKLNDYVNDLVYEDNKDVNLKDLASREKDLDEEDRNKGTEDQLTDDNKGSKENTSLNNDTSETIMVETLNELLNIEGLEFAYKSYDFYEEYPKKADSYFNLTLKDGNQLLVVSFSVHNTSNEKIELNLSTSDINYTVNINQETVYKPIMTLLQEDIHFINEVIDGGEEITALLIFEVPKDTVVSKLDLKVNQGDKSTIINLE